MSTEPRTVSLATADRGQVTIPEPAWCIGHQDHDPDTQFVDLIHTGPEAAVTFRHVELLAAGIVQSPHATSSADELGGPTPGVSVWPLAATLAPAGLYDLAAELDAYADRLRELADQLDQVLGGDR